MNLIVFDIDDTLTKSEYQHQLAYVNTMNEFGITQIDTNWKEYTHHTDSFILKENYERNHDLKFDFSIVSAFENQMTNTILSLEEVSEINGAKNIVEFFNEQTDYAIAFATGSFLKPARVKLKQAEIKFNEELVIGSNEFFEREEIVKEAIIQAEKYHNVNHFNEIISVGDGIWDLKTARNLGVHFIGIGMKNYADFQKNNIKVHIEDWNDFNLSLIEEKLGIRNT